MSEPSDPPTTPGVGISQQHILNELRRRGRCTLAELAGTLSLTAPTLRQHLKSLSVSGFVAEAGRRGGGPGRPSTLYALTPRGEELFPLLESQLLRELAEYLIDRGQEDLLEEFFKQRAEQTRSDIERRVEGLTGQRRLEAVARIMTERGFMAEIAPADEQATHLPQLRLCNCPLRHVIAVTKIPCRTEIHMLEQLVGRDMIRADYMPDGDTACSYAMSSTTETA